LAPADTLLVAFAEMAVSFSHLRFAFPVKRVSKFGARLSTNPFVQRPIGHGFATVAGTGRTKTTRSFLGTTAGTALFVVSGSLLVWPAADLCLGPRLALWGMKVQAPVAPNMTTASPFSTRLSEEVASRTKASLLIVTGEGGVGKRLEYDAAETRKCVVYVSLREATSPHDLFFAMMTGIYSAERLGFLGTLAHSTGVWWIVLFDIIVGHEPEKTRAFNFSIVLQHAKRALRLAHAEQLQNSSRPLVIFDHLDDLSAKGCPAMRSMIVHLVAWCAATCYDEGLADIVICNEAVESSSWRGSSKKERVERLDDATAWQRFVKRQWLW